eukprot:Sspe_Gene.23478::Locus_9118_Transcript_1_1_Confidence_1.000_Length_8738::g.23478::m.23478
MPASPPCLLPVLLTLLPTLIAASANATTQHTIETYPSLLPIVEAGVYFRIRLIAYNPERCCRLLSRNGTEDGGAGLRIIRAFDDDGGGVYCNSTLPTDVLAESLDLSAGSLNNTADLMQAKVTGDDEATDGYATFAAPPVPFRICYVNPNETGDWWAPVGEPYYNVTASSFTWTLVNGDATPGTYAALGISGLQPHSRDVLKLTQQGRDCIEEVGPADPFPFYPAGALFHESVPTNAVRVAFPDRHGYVRCQLPLHSGAYRVCISIEAERNHSSPGWRVIPSSGGEWALALATWGHNLSVGTNDSTEYSFAVLKVVDTSGSLTPFPATSSAWAPAQTGGDMLRIIPIHEGCWSRVVLGPAGSNYTDLLGPTEVTHMVAGLGAGEVWGPVRLPGKGEYLVCYRRVGKNWVGLPFTVSRPALNLSWELPDTTAGSQAAIAIRAQFDVLSTLPSPSPMAVAFKLVHPHESCLLSDGVASVTNLGVLRESNVTWDNDDPSLTTSAVYAFITVPPVSDGYRVCAKYGFGAWAELPPLLVPSPPSDVRHLASNDTAGGSEALLSLASPTRPFRSGELRLVPPPRLCAPTARDPFPTVSDFVPCQLPCLEDKEKGYDVAVRVTLPRTVGLYQVCFRNETTANWVVAGSLTVTRGAQLAVTGVDGMSGMLGTVRILRLTGPPLRSTDTAVLVRTWEPCASTVEATTVSSGLLSFLFPPALESVHYSVCYRHTAHLNWVRVAGMATVPYSGMSFVALGALVQATVVEVVFLSRGLSDIRPGADAAAVASYKRRCHEEDKEPLPVSALGPVAEVGRTLAVVSVELARVGRYRVCYRMQGVWFEVHETNSPVVGFRAVPLPTPNNFTVAAAAPLTFGFSGTLSPVSGASHPPAVPVVAGAVGSMLISTTLPMLDPRADRVKLVPDGPMACTSPATVASTSGACAEGATRAKSACSKVSMPIELPLSPGLYAVCYGSASRWRSVQGKVEVVESLILAEWEPPLVVVRDLTYNTFTLLHEPALSAQDTVTVVPLGWPCSTPPARSPFHIASNSTAPLPLQCRNASVLDCPSEMTTLPVTPPKGTFRVCIAKGSRGGRIPSPMKMAVPSPLHVSNPVRRLGWVGGGTPFDQYNYSYPVPLGDPLEAEVEVQADDGSRAHVEMLVSARLTVVTGKLSGVMRNFAGECDWTQAPRYAIPDTNTLQWAREGVVRFLFMIYQDCSPGCQITFSASGVAPLVSPVFYTSPASPAAIRLLPSEVGPTVASETVWSQVIVSVVDSFGAPVAGRPLQVRLMASNLGSATMRCHVQGSPCGAMASPGPFAVWTNGSGQAVANVGLTGAVPATPVVVDAYLAQDVTIKGRMRVHGLNVSLQKVLMVSGPTSEVVAGVPVGVSFRLGDTAGRPTSAPSSWAMRGTWHPSNVSQVVAAVPSGGVWTGTLLPPWDCGRGCRLLVSAGNVTSTFPIPVREEAVGLRFSRRTVPVVLGEPLHVSVEAVGVHGERDWKKRGLVWVYGDGLAPHNPYVMEDGVVVLRGITVLHHSDVAIAAAMHNLSVATATLTPLADIASVNLTLVTPRGTPVAPITGRVLAEQWFEVVVHGIKNDGSPSSSDNHTAVHLVGSYGTQGTRPTSDVISSITPPPSGPPPMYSVDGPSEVRMHMSRAAFRVRLDGACYSCGFLFAAVPGSVWQAGVPSRFHTLPVDAAASPVMTAIRVEPGEGMVRVDGNWFVIPRNTTVRFRLIGYDESWDVVDHSASSFIQLSVSRTASLSGDPPIPGGDFRLGGGVASVTVRLPSGCLQCTLLAESASVQTNVTFTAPPSLTHFVANVTPSTVVVGEAVSVTVALYDGNHLSYFTPRNATVTVQDRAQELICDGCLPGFDRGWVLVVAIPVQSPAEQAADPRGGWKRIHIWGVHPDRDVSLTVHVDGMPLQTLRVVWSGLRVPRRIEVRTHDIVVPAPVVQQGGVVGVANLSWWHGVGEVVVGQEAPFEVAAVDEHGVVPSAAGTVIPSLTPSHGCNSGAPLTAYGVAKDGSRIVAPIPLVEGTALIRIAFGSPCQSCRVLFTFIPHPDAHDTVAPALRTALSSPTTVLPNTPSLLALDSQPSPPPLVPHTTPQSFKVFAGRNVGRVFVMSSGYTATVTVRFLAPDTGVSTNTSIRMTNGTALFNNTLPRHCRTGCTALVSVAALPPVSLPWLFTVTFNVAAVVLSGPSVVAEGAFFVLSAVATDETGARVPAFNGSKTMRLSRDEGGGNGDGGRLEWEGRAFELSTQPFESTTWGEGVQVWLLRFTAACTRCTLRLNGVPHVVTVVAPPTALAIQFLSTKSPLIGQPVTFRVVATDKAGNWAEGFSAPVSIGGSSAVTFRSPSDPSRPNTTAVTLIKGRAWVAIAYTRPGRVALVASAGALRSQAEELAVDTVASQLVVLPYPNATANNTLPITVGLADGAGHLSLRSTSFEVAITALPCPATTVVVSPDRARLAEGRVTISVVFLRTSLLPVTCSLRAEAPPGLLARRSVTMEVHVTTARCTRLTLQPRLPTFVVVGSKVTTTVVCIDEAGNVDPTVRGDVDIQRTPWSECTFTAHTVSPLESGHATAEITATGPGEGCGLVVATNAIPALVVGNITAQRVASFDYLRNVSDDNPQVFAGEPVHLYAAFFDSDGSVVAGNRERVAVRVEFSDSPVPFRVVGDLSTPQDDGEQQGVWHVAVVFAARVAGFARVVLEAGVLQAVSEWFPVSVAAQKLAWDLPPPRYLVTNRTFEIGVVATDRSGDFFTTGDNTISPDDDGAGALVRVRELEAVELRAFVNQSALLTADGQRLTRQLRGGRRQFVLRWSGGDKVALLAVLGEAGGLLPSSPFEVTFQAINHVRVVMSTSHPQARIPFQIEVVVSDAAGNAVRGDNTSNVTMGWITREGTVQ